MILLHSLDSYHSEEEARKGVPPKSILQIHKIVTKIFFHTIFSPFSIPLYLPVTSIRIRSATPTFPVRSKLCAYLIRAACSLAYILFFCAWLYPGVAVTAADQQKYQQFNVKNTLYKRFLLVYVVFHNEMIFFLVFHSLLSECKNVSWYLDFSLEYISSVEMEVEVGVGVPLCWCFSVTQLLLALFVYFAVTPCITFDCWQNISWQMLLPTCLSYWSKLRLAKMNINNTEHSSTEKEEKNADI